MVIVNRTLGRAVPPTQDAPSRRTPIQLVALPIVATNPVVSAAPGRSNRADMDTEAHNTRTLGLRRFHAHI